MVGDDFHITNCGAEQKFTSAFIQPSSIREKYCVALVNHTTRDYNYNGCTFCLEVHSRQGKDIA